MISLPLRYSGLMPELECCYALSDDRVIQLLSDRGRGVGLLDGQCAWMVSMTLLLLFERH